MKKKFCRGFLALTFTLLCLKIPAQQALKIGETLPESFWTTPLQVVNHPEKTITLDKDRGKLILLDFWNTWCSACLLGFPKMEALQKEFGDQIKVLAVTDQNRPAIEKFFAGKNGQRYNTMVSVTGETQLKKYFPHVYVPHIVWLKDGKLLNTTDIEQVTAETLTAVLKDRNEVLQQVIDYKQKGPFMPAEQLPLEKGFTLTHYTFFGRGRIRATGYGSSLHYAGDTVHGRTFRNLALGEIFTAIATEILLERGEGVHPTRIFSEVKDPAAFFNKPGPNERQDPDHLYTYDFIIPPSRSKFLYPDMLTALNQAAPYTGTWEKKQMPVLVLTQKGKSSLIASKGGELSGYFRPSGGKIQNVPIRNFLNFLNGQLGISVPVLNETGFDGNVDFSFGDISSLPKLTKELARYGLTLTQADREIEVLVLRDK